MGKNEIDFTGGEATLHKHFGEMVSYAKSLGFKTINVITNGWRFSNLKHYEDFVKLGLNETLFSLHSHIEEIHDNLTQMKGSYQKLLQAIRNAKTLGVKVRMNMVVSPMNHHTLDDYLEFVKQFSPSEMNFIVYNPSEETVGYENHKNVRLNNYQEIGQALLQATEKHRKDFKIINVRFLPFCYMKGGEAMIRTYWQEIYESQEWDPLLHWSFRKNPILVAGAAVLGTLIAWVKPSPILSGRKSPYTWIAELFQVTRIFLLFKHDHKCKTCSLKKICPGLPKELIKTGDQIAVYPYSKEDYPMILNPFFFGQNDKEKFPSFKPAEDFKNHAPEL